MPAVALVLQLLIVGGALYDTVRLLRSYGRRRSERRRLRLEAAERRLARGRLNGTIDAARYRAGMRAVAEDDSRR